MSADTSANSDFVISGALVYDGFSPAPYESDVFVSGGVIREITPPSSAVAPGYVKIEAEGLSLAPGFIDTHGHSDVSILAAPEAFGKISQGITSEVAGNCGLSPFPVATGEVREHLAKLYENYNVPITWDDIASYSSEFESRSPSINMASLCGHNTLRAAVMGYAEKESIPEDWRRMSHLLEKELRNGAQGLSTGLLYIPGKFSSKEELMSLMGVLRSESKIYATHLRSEGAKLLEAVDEALELARAGAGRLQVSHLKTAQKQNWHKITPLLEKLNAARASGLGVTVDRYPYTYGQTSLSVILPPPYDKMRDREIQEILHSDAAARNALEAELAKNDFWGGIILTSSLAGFAEGLFGLSFDKAAEKAGLSPAKLCVMLMAEDATGTMAAFGGLSEDNLRKIISQDWVCCGSDESARPRDFSIGRSHPRGFGSFPKFMNILRSEGFSMSEAVHRVTSLPASIFRLKNRGMIKESYAADMVLFDEAAFADSATFAAPHSPASGVKSVWVGGVLSYDGESQTVCGWNGRFLKS